MIDAIRYAHLADVERHLAIYGNVAFADLSTEDLEFLFEDFKDREELENEVWRLREKVLYLQEEKQELQSQVEDLKYENEKLEDRLEMLKERPDAEA